MILRVCRWMACVVLMVAGFATAHAGCADQPRLLGVNLSGAEFGQKHLPGVLNKDYVYPALADLSYFQRQGMNLVRLPFRWERVQRQLYGPLDATELVQLRTVIAWAEQANVCVLLDLHNFGTYHGKALGSSELPVPALIDVWKRLHQEFPDTRWVAYGLMNEPSALPVRQWMALAQETVLALRKAGVKNLLMVASGRWSGAHEWEKAFDGVSAAIAFAAFKDPLNNFAIELHQYADSNFSGMQKTCVDARRLRDVMDRVTRWALREKKRLFLGEFGVPNSPECLAALAAMLDGTQNADAWMGWAYWSAGAWWGNYPLSIQPGTVPAPAQLQVLRSYLPTSTGTH
ncbi:MAG: glycoside hydrolase family 5 protein [Rhodoferax sp.]|nr:glycoside hydrolase family 5 protein [Rhodoferax sp.]